MSTGHVRLSLWVLTASLLLVGTFTTAPAEATITLTPVSTGFNGIIGIDHHGPTNQVIISVNYNTGSPYNFELVAFDGTRTQFSSISGFTDEVKIASVRSSACQGGFTPGELFTGTGAAGVIARISPDGLTVQNPWVTLPGETGLMRGSLFQDRYCSFSGDLIAVTTDGGVWRVTSAGAATLLADLNVHLEGLTTVPADPVQYGPWAGRILAGAEGLGCLYSIDTSGSATCWTLGINPEDIDIIPAGQNFFAVDYGAQTILGAPPSEFAGMVGDLLVTQESGPASLFHVWWDAGSNSFQSAEVAQGTSFEHVTFSTAGIVEIPPVTSPCPLSQGFWKNHPEGWPVTSLTLGIQTYDQAKLLALLRTPVKGDGSLILGHQLIAAKLNVANGSDPAPINASLDASDALLGTFTGRLPYGIKPSSPTGQAAVTLAAALDEYNNGLLTPDCEDFEADGPTGPPAPTTTVEATATDVAEDTPVASTNPPTPSPRSCPGKPLLLLIPLALASIVAATLLRRQHG